MVTKRKISDVFLGESVSILKRPKYNIYVIKDRCKGCEICVEFCPVEILELDNSEFNAKGYHPPRIKPGLTADDCTGCEYCSISCPEFAIYIKEIKE